MGIRAGACDADVFGIQDRLPLTTTRADPAIERGSDQESMTLASHITFPKMSKFHETAIWSSPDRRDLAKSIFGCFEFSSRRNGLPFPPMSQYGALTRPPTSPDMDEVHNCNSVKEVLICSSADVRTAEKTNPTFPVSAAEPKGILRTPGSPSLSPTLASRVRFANIVDVHEIELSELGEERKGERAHRRIRFEPLPEPALSFEDSISECDTNDSFDEDIQLNRPRSRSYKSMDLETLVSSLS